MNPVLLRLLASLKIPAYIAIGCGGTLTVQRYTASSSLSWDEKAATEKEDSGKGMKFEINQLSKQLEEKEQSLKLWEELLAKKDADLKERLAAVSSEPARMTVATTVAEPKPDQPIIDDVPFGEEDAKSGKLKASNIAQLGIAKEEAEVPTDSVPKRPAVFDGGGTPAVAFPPTTDVVTVERQSDVPEELRTKDRTLEGLRERLGLLEAESAEKNRQLSDLRTSNEDLKRELKETKKKLAKAEADAKKKALGWEPESNIAFSCLRDGEWEDPKKRSEYLKDWLSQRRLLPEEGSFAVCRLKPKEASSLWWSLLLFCPYAKRAYNEYLDLCRGASNSKAVRNGKVNLSDVNKYYAFEPVSMYVCATGNPRGGMVVKKGKDRYSVRKPERWWFWLFCPCKRKANEIRKLKYEEAVIEVTSEEPQDSVKIPELFDRLDPEERKAFEQLEPTGIGNGKWTPLKVESTPKSGIFGFFEGIGNYFNSFIGIMSAFGDGTEELQGADPAQFRDNEDF